MFNFSVANVVCESTLIRGKRVKDDVSDNGYTGTGVSNLGLGAA